MARYVVLEFADNKDADNFVDSVRENGGVFMNVKHPTLENQYSTVRPRNDYAVVGYYMRPTQVCDCPPPPQNQKRGLSQGPKYGLWVHNCGKILKIAMEAWGHHPGLGRNLLVDNERMKEISQEGKLVEGLLRIDGSVPRMAIRTPEDYKQFGKPGYQGGGR